ncbi:uncharacterized protein [Agelaius tricolor]|uniref:uncharacterized protein isoform X1 n=1 Tax=Agelaius tricolor TaxID=9191 RepID=UPI0039F1DBA6
MGFVDGHKTSGALKLSCNSLSFVLTFFSDSDGLNVCQRAPSRVRGFPRAGSKCGYQQSRQSTRSAIRVAFGSCPGVVVSPVATASVSECARSVRPKQLSVLKRRLSKRHQPGASRTFPADEVQMHCIHGRAPHPGKYSRISAVKFKRVRPSARSMPSSHPQRAARPGLPLSRALRSGQPSGTAEELRRTPRRWHRPPSAAGACDPKSRAFLGAGCLRDNGPVPAGPSQLTRRPSFAPDMDWDFHMSKRFRWIKCVPEGPIPSEGFPPCRKQMWIPAVKAIHSEYAKPLSPAGRCTGFPANMSPVDALQDLVMKP